MAVLSSGYSASPQARKLGVKSGLRICLDGQPPSWQLEDPPNDLIYLVAPAAADLVIGFFTTAASLPIRLPELTQRVFPDGALWIAWPRRAGGHRSDITDNIIREVALPLGVVDNKVAAIDTDWSGQRYVWRLENRTKHT